LLAKNAKVYLAARSEDRAKAAIEDLKQTTGNAAIWLKLDLSSLKSVKAAAEEFLGWVRSDSERAISDSCFN
jgi:NAD(P)-dependent dehydrogenase (short-subunit alcohol dehydrogenase family)